MTIHLPRGRAWAPLVAGGLCALACGYRFTAGGAPLPEGIRAVCAPIMKLRSQGCTDLGASCPAPGVELLFTQSLREHLIRAGVAGRPECDAQIEGEVISVFGMPTVSTTPPLNTNLSSTNTSLQLPSTLASYRVSASVRLKLVKGTRTLTETVISGSEDYLPGPGKVYGPATHEVVIGAGDVLQTEASHEAALHRLSDSMMRDGYERLASGW